MANINKIKTAFRTTGQVTGNFGKTKVKAGAALNDLGNGKVGCLPTKAEHLDRLLLAYPKLNDRVRVTILAEIRKLAVTLGRIDEVNALTA